MHSKTLTLGVAVLAIVGCDSNSRPPPVNQAPTITAITDQTVSANIPSAPIAFTVADEDPANLTVDVMTDNEALLPLAAIQLSGATTARSIVLTPTADTTGDAQISVVVTDADGLGDSTSFIVSVAPESRSLQTFVRSEFAEDADDAPDLVNALEFIADADDDDFADLFAD